MKQKSVMFKYFLVGPNLTIQNQLKSILSVCCVGKGVVGGIGRGRAMKELAQNITYTRSCRHCQNFNDFKEEPEEMYIFCSDKCRFRFIWNILKQYSDEEIKIKMCYKIPKFQLFKFDRQQWMFQLTKIIMEETK